MSSSLTVRPTNRYQINIKSVLISCKKKYKNKSRLLSSVVVMEEPFSIRFRAIFKAEFSLFPPDLPKKMTSTPKKNTKTQ